MADLIVPTITAAAGFIGGMATQWFTRWTAEWFTRREIRSAIKAEITPIVITLNFYILKAIEAIPDEDAIGLQYFGTEMQFGAFDYYWSERREQLLTLPEWPRLQSWYTGVRTIKQSDHPILFKAIMSLDSLLIPPVDACVDAGTKRVIKRTLGQKDVEQFKTDYLLRAARLRSTHGPSA